jgi:hypothetical protein
VWLLVGPVTTGAVSSPELRIDSPAELLTTAARLERWDPTSLSSFRRLIGLEEWGTTIQVFLVSEVSAEAMGIPSWIAGYARGTEGAIVLFPARIPAYPHSSLEAALSHEVAHILITRAVGGRRLPRWFNEGLALMAEDAWGLAHRSRLTMALLRGRRYALADLDSHFAGDRSQVSRAYALSGAFVRDLVRRHGRSAPAEILARVAAGASFGRAFSETIDTPLAEAERSFWRRFGFWYRWLPILSSSSTLWILITGLALLAIRRRRERDRALAEKWEREERWLTEDEPGRR